MSLWDRIKMKFPVCTLSKVINPGQYSVISNDKEHISEVKDLEDKMKKEMNLEDTSRFELSPQMCVAVVDSNEKFKRGVIEKRLTQDIYKVLLMDYGKIIQVKKSKLKVILNENYMKTEPLAFTVKLYGLIPTSYVPIGASRKAKACKEWREESRVFVESLFKENHKLVVKCILIEQRTVYGDIFVQPKAKMKFVSLRKLLCKNEFCAYSESLFLQQEGLDTSNENLGIATKMEFVEKWQKESFGNQKGSSWWYASESCSKSNLAKSGSSSQSTHKSVSKSVEKSNQILDQNREIFGGSQSDFKSIGIGRGKLKLLIEEIKKKEETLSSSNGTPLQTDSSINRLETKVSLGRGQFLKKYLEIKKSNTKKCPSSDSLTKAVENNSVPEKQDRDSEMPFARVTSQIKRKVVKPGDFSELSDSNELTEVSLSTENEPTLVSSRSLKKIKGEDETQSDCDVGLNVSERDSKGRKSDSCRRNPKRYLEEHWQFTSRQKNSCWTPYVQFHDSVVEPVKTFKELPIKPSVIKNLEKGGTFDYLGPVQRWAIPSIRKQLNTILIGSSKTGKTLSYIVSLMDYVQDDSYFEELPQGNGPLIVIIASSSRVCESIYDLCHSLLGHQSRHEKVKAKVKVVLARGGGREEDVWVSLTNGCDVLISTPHCMNRLLEWSILTNFERLMCLVLDEVDVISDNPFRKHTRIILEKAECSAKNRHFQRIFCGERWTLGVESLVKAYVKSYALVIGSYMEAVVYEGIKPSIYLVDQQKKSDLVLEKLKDFGKSKILVVCEEASEAVRLNDFLSERGVSSFAAHENLLADNLKDFREIWNSSDSVLIATDGVLNELNISDARLLVHFGLPWKSKTNFYLRYRTLENFLRNKMKKKDKNLHSRVRDIILIDDENHYQLPHIVDFIVRLGGKVPINIQEKCQEIRREMEVKKLNSPVCSNLLAFGRCRDQKNCPRRHALLKESDSPSNLPISGWVSFLVLRTHDACCFSVRLLELTDSQGKKSKLNERYLELPIELSEFYKKESNRRPHGMPAVGDVCAVKTKILQQDVFYRAKVIEYLKVDKYEKPLEVSVKLIDQGEVWKQKNIELYELPEELSKQTPTAVDVRIVGLQPLDFDVSWSKVANGFTENLMSQKLGENQYWSGRIVLALNDTLYLDPVRRKEFLPHLNTHVFDLTIRDELLHDKIAVPNDSHLSALMTLCSEGGIEVPKTEDETKEDVDMVSSQWAFLDADFVEVKFLAAESTSKVFLQLKKFEKQLLELEEDCQTEGEAKVGKPNSTVSAGTFCLALFEDGKWNRGRVESESVKQFEVFFVDHGDFHFVPKEDVVPISQTLLLRLPFQAVECSLTGIAEKEDCPLEVLKEIYAFSNDGRDSLYGLVVRKDLIPNSTHGRKYSLNLVNKRGVSLNKMLVDCEMVGVEEAEREHLEDIVIGISDDEEQREGENEEDLHGSTFDDLNEDVFEDEGAQEFLKEFAAMVFGLRESSQENKPHEEKQFRPEKTESQKKGVQDVRRLLDLSKKRRIKVKKLEMTGREKVLTPQLAWCQNQTEIHIKVLLRNVSDFSLECGVENLSFRCFSEDQFYAFDVKMYGAVNPQMTKVVPKTFHVVVVLTKLAFPAWPRLQKDEEKLRWIKLDVESLEDKESAFSDKIRSVKLEIESGMLTKGTRSEKIFPCSDSEVSDFEVETDSEYEVTD